MIMINESKIWVSREILSGGPGYKVLLERTKKQGGRKHMGRAVYTVYVPASPEWEPPAHLVGRWWKLVNENGNTVGLKAFIPPPERRHYYGSARPEDFNHLRERIVRPEPLWRRLGF